MRLVHYSSKPFVFDSGRVYKQRDHHKPVGLWVSVQGEDDWPSWCDSEQWGLDALIHASELELAPSAKILIVDTLEKLDDFHNTHNKGGEAFWESRNIHWDKLISSYDGIIIAPYRWERRLEYMWYYGWDCASGVIWNLDCVSQVTALNLDVIESK